MSTLTTPHHLGEPSPDEEDRTGVRAILSGLSAPDPMPATLVARISASLAAEQAQRAALPFSASVTPLLSTSRRRPGRLLFAIAGAAADVAMIGVVGSNLLNTNQLTSASDTAGSAMTRGSPEANSLAPPSAEDKAAPHAYAAPASIQIRESAVRYTRADFAAQAQTLSGATFDAGQPAAGGSRVRDTFATPNGVAGCLGGLGVTGAQEVRADLAFYEGQPAVIIVAAAKGVRTAYAVGRECSPANPALLQPPVALP